MPFKSGIVFGLYVSGWILLITFLCVSGGFVVLAIVEFFGFDSSGATVLIVVIIPAYLAGLPWNHLTIENSAAPQSFVTYGWGAVVGILINGLILGVVIGVLATVRQVIQSKVLWIKQK